MTVQPPGALLRMACKSRWMPSPVVDRERAGPVTGFGRARGSSLETPTFGAYYAPSNKLVQFPNQSILEFGHCEDRAAAANG